jgi:hypothetical protein
METPVVATFDAVLDSALNWLSVGIDIVQPFCLKHVIVTANCFDLTS